MKTMTTRERPICKICFKPISDYTFYNFVTKEVCLCDNCLSKMSAKFHYFKVNGYNAMAIFDYDDNIKEFIYQFKGCFDIELNKIFLERYLHEIRLLYTGYTIIPAPSFEEEDRIREFNHVDEIFSKLGLEVIKCIKKNSPFKQASHNSNERSEISKHLELIGDIDLYSKKVLLVDDVYTTGSTMKAMIKLIEPLKPKKIKILVISKTILKPKDT